MTNVSGDQEYLFVGIDNLSDMLVGAKCLSAKTRSRVESLFFDFFFS